MILFFLVAITLFRSVWLLVLIAEKTVNIPYFDQFDLLAGLTHTTTVEQFTYLFYPHRQGIAYSIWGFFFTNGVYDYRIPSVIAWFGMVLSTVVALAILKKVNKRFSLVDGIIPFFFLSPKLFETVFYAANPSHGSFSLLLMLISLYTFTFKDWRTRGIAIIVASFVTTFSGFGLVFIPTLLLYAVLRLVTFRRHATSFKEIIPLLMAIAVSVVAFFHTYTFYFDIECVSSRGIQAFPLKVEYAAYMLASVVGFSETGFAALLVGISVLGGCVLLCTILSIKILKSSRNDFATVVSFLLLTFSIFFIFLTAHGRVCLGQETAFAGRYIPYGLPAILGCYLFFRKFPCKVGGMKGYVLLAIVLMVIEIKSHDRWMQGIQYVFDQKNIMYSCTQGDLKKIITCQEKTGIIIYPDTQQLEKIITILTTYINKSK